MSKSLTGAARLLTTARVYYNWAAESARQSLRFRQNARRFASNDEMLSIVIRSEIGLFGQLSWCLEIAEYCRRNQRALRMSCISPQYSGRGENWFGTLFATPAAEKIEASNKRLVQPMCIRRYEDLPFWKFAHGLTLQASRKTQQQYFPVRGEILSRVDQFVELHFGELPVIGCHYRGTDKRFEAARISYAEMTEAIKARLADYQGGASLFVASDEAGFVDHIRRAIPSVKVVTANHRRSSDGQALHTTGNERGLQNAIEALTDCLLLSRCRALVKSPSLLSSWSVVFNPSLPVTLVGRPNADTLWFPENLLHKNSSGSGRR